MYTIISIVGRSGAGKTTLIEKLIPELRGRGLKIGTIKHNLHGFEIDIPGKDSSRHKQAGSTTTIISSPHQIGMIMDVDHDHELDELAPLLADMDIILTEGYKRDSKPKIEVLGPDVDKEPILKDDDNLIAVVSDEEVDLSVPRFKTGDIKGLADFLLK